LAARRIEDYKKHREIVIHPPSPVLPAKQEIKMTRQDSRDKLTEKGKKVMSFEKVKQNISVVL
jgi:hypothetical protein